MIKIKKTGQTQYGKWVQFEFIGNMIFINGIAKCNLDLEEGKIYTNLCLITNQRNDKIKYQIVENEL